MRHAAWVMGLGVAGFLLLSGGLAEAQVGGGFTGRNELSGTMGPAFNFNSYTPGGFKLQNEYGYHMGQISWLNLQLNFTLGGDGSGVCFDAVGRAYSCGWGFSGDGIEAIAGVKLKWRRGRLMPYAKFGGGLEFAWYDSTYGGTAIVFRGGGGFKYYVVRNLAVGGEMNLTVGPEFVSENHSTDLHMYASLDLMGGIEYNF
jgi:hypothetical protein